MSGSSPTAATSSSSAAAAAAAAGAPSRPPPPKSSSSARVLPRDLGDGTFEFTLQQTSFRLTSNLRPLGIVGKGSYGVVCAAVDSGWGGGGAGGTALSSSSSPTPSSSSPPSEADGGGTTKKGSPPTPSGRKVAIKKIMPVWDDVWDAKHTLRELRLMRLLDKHPNVISLLDLQLYDTALYIVMELMDSDLHKIIQSKQMLTIPHCQVIMNQIFLGVKAMHDSGVLHRDLKPGNILVGRDCQIRITDFGLARAYAPSLQSDAPPSGGSGIDDDANPASALTEYVVTRWYRCPELLLAPHVAYTTAVDVWSVGCIMAEMVLRQPLFPGRSYVHQVGLILDVVGLPPTEAEMGFEPRSDAKAYLARQVRKPAKPWHKVLKPEGGGDSPSYETVDLISKLLLFNPDKRLSCADALQHEYFDGCPPLPCKVEEKTPHGNNWSGANTNVDFKFDNDKVTLDELRDHIREEVRICTVNREATIKTAASALNTISSPMPRTAAEAPPASRFQRQPSASKLTKKKSSNSLTGKAQKAIETKPEDTSPNETYLTAQNSEEDGTPPSAAVATTKKGTPSLPNQPQPQDPGSIFDKKMLVRTSSSGCIQCLSGDGAGTAGILLSESPGAAAMKMQKGAGAQAASRTRTKLEDAIKSAATVVSGNASNNNNNNSGPRS